MKRLNKITLILVAVMGMVISGCGSDMKKAPFIIFDSKTEDAVTIMLINNLDIPTKESEAIYKKLKVKKITLLGRKECPLQDLSEKSDGITVYMYEVKNRADCPPKDRLKRESYEITLNTNYGTFLYNISDRNTKRTQRVLGGERIWYVPVNYNNKGGNK